MNIFLIGMLVTLVAYIIVSFFVSKKVKNANDFFVAGRNAPAYLITGSLIASFIGVGLFMGDVGECYSGYFAPIMVAVGILSVGYIVGSVFFGRYLRRSNVDTIPQFFEKRFNSKAIGMLTTITGSIIMLIYSLSCVQGISTLMESVTGIDYKLCVVIVVCAFTTITIFSGAKGVLITDTIMFAIFSIATIVGAGFIAQSAGGWMNSVELLKNYENVPNILAWTGNLDYAYNNGVDNLIWAFGYGIAWMSVLMVAPWQSSRYLMAKNEHACVRSSIVASASVFIIEFLMCMAGVFVNKINPNLPDASKALIWASMNIMPPILGIIVLSGVLASGVSSATTFLSLVGSDLTNNIFKVKEKNKVLIGRLIILFISIVVCVLCIINPPAIFWITYLGATVIACSWLPVALGSVWSKRITKFGAFLGMLLGFLTSGSLKIIFAVCNISVPIYLDPFFIGFAVSIVSIILGSCFTKVTDEERKQRDALFIVPEIEKDPKEIKKTKTVLIVGIPIGIIIMCLLLLFWAIPISI